MSARRPTAKAVAKASATSPAKRTVKAAAKAAAPKPSPDARRAADRLKRLLLTLPLLADEGWHPIAEVAARVGAAPAVVLEDLQSLQERIVGDVAGFIDGIQILIERDRVCMQSKLFKRPMGLSPHELRAVELGLAVLRQERPPEEHAAIERARARLASLGALDPAPRAHVADWGTVGDVRHLATVQRALLARQIVRIAYRAASSDETTERRVHPYRLLFGNGHWFLVAWCEKSAAVRVFRVDRIRRAALEPDTYELPATLDVEALVKGGHVFVNNGTTETLVVRYGPRIARWIAERERGEVQLDGSLVVTWPLADVAWAVRHVLQYGPDAEVLSPPAVRERLRDLLAALVAEG